MSPSHGSVTRLLAPLQAGDPAAVQRLWEHYFPLLVGLARGKLHAAPRRVADEEDVALSAFASFCRGAEQGKFPRLLDRDSLWRLLVVITVRKAAHLVRDEGPRPQPGGPPSNDWPLLEQVVSREPTPEVAAEVAEQFQRLLRLLGDPDLEAVALWRMEGFTEKEIARKLGCVERTVKRKLSRIRGIWKQEMGP